ncbi:MAG: amidohydrolase family protein, partial [Clostridia bacterium]|nr:amidohydrolase family protein [Clostridia bacterium]
DGEYRIAGETVVLRDGEARTRDGALAGSTLTLDRAVRLYMQFTGASLAEAWHSASLAPAQEVGIDPETGSLDPGKRADLVLVRYDGTPESVSCASVFLGGVRVG